MTTTIHTPSAIDPVCGMAIPIASAAATFTHDGTTFHFCSPSCRTAFEAAPGEYVKPRESERGSCCGGGSCAMG